MRRRKTDVVPAETARPVDRFDLDLWLELVPDDTSPWAPAELRHQHRCSRAYVLFLKARREAGVVPRPVR